MSHTATLMRRVPTASLGALRYTSSLSHAKLTVAKSTQPKPKPTDNDTLGFGQIFTDHMLTIDWDKNTGWHAPAITPFQNLSLSPSTCVFHYAQECFEGMKAYYGDDGKIRLFRPDLNMKRLNNSAKRVGLPTFDSEEYIKCLSDLVLVDADWIPRSNTPGYSMYIRPTLIGTEPTLGVKMTESAKFFTILSPVGAYYSTGFKPVRLFATSTYQRAWPGGTGAAKVGGNYAPTLVPQAEAAAKGYNQVLWLFGEEQEITEVGTMNLFVFWINENGEKELVTPPLDGTILPGVTRQSILDMAREWGEFQVTEKSVTIHQVKAALKDGRMLEMFGSGTAATVSPIQEINHDNDILTIPLGDITQRVMDTVFDIQYGRVSHDWGVVISE